MIGRLRASCSQRDRFCCRTPVCRANCDALTALLPVSRWTIFCLKATENGLLMSSSSSRPSEVQLRTTRQLSWNRGGPGCRAGPGNLDSEISDSLASTTGCASSPIPGASNGKKEATHAFGEVQGASSACGHQRG